MNNMAKKLDRVYRDRHLTPEEAARDAEIRRNVVEEYPPSRPTGADNLLALERQSSLSGLLKRTIRESGRSVEEIASDAGLPTALVIRFLSGERDIHMATADKLAESLGLKLATK